MTPYHLRARLRSALFAFSERPPAPDTTTPFSVVCRRAVTLEWREGRLTPSGLPVEVEVNLDRAGDLPLSVLASRMRDVADQLDEQARARGAK